MIIIFTGRAFLIRFCVIPGRSRRSGIILSGFSCSPDTAAFFRFRSRCVKKRFRLGYEFIALPFCAVFRRLKLSILRNSGYWFSRICFLRSRFRCFRNLTVFRSFGIICRLRIRNFCAVGIIPVLRFRDGIFHFLRLLFSTVL